MVGEIIKGVVTFLCKKKCLLIYGQEAIQMFSQRNNPYCESLQIVLKYKKII